MRIISLIPEATEILQALGLEDQIVRAPSWGCAGVGGRDPSDLTPPTWDSARSTPATWAGRDLTADSLMAARPTLIFASETWAGGGVPRWLVRKLVVSRQPPLTPRPAIYALEPHTLGDILSDIKTVGDATGQQQTARALIERLRARIDAVSLRAAEALAAGPPRRVVCLQQAEPPVAAGWWLAELVGLAGGIDVLDGVGRPPRAVTGDEIRAARPDLVLRMDLTPPGERGAVHPGPGTVERLERLLASIVPQPSGSNHQG